MADNPYGLGPGAAVADTLQSILANRRASERQVMIDQLSQKKVDADIATAQDNAATNKVYREGQAENLLSQKQARESASTRLEALANYAKQQQSDDPNINAMWGMIAADPSRGEQLAQALLSREMSKPKMVPGYSVDAKGKLIPMTTPMGLNESGPPAPYMVKEGTEPSPLHYPPNPSQPNAATATQLFQRNEPDPTDPKKTNQVSYWLKPGEMPNERNMIPGGVLNKDRNLPVPPRPFQLSAAEKNNLTKLRAKAEPISGWFGTTAPKDQDVAAYRQGQMNIISGYPTTPDVRDTVADVLNSTDDATTPTVDIVERHKDVLPPDELEQFADLLRQVRGN